MHLQTFSLQIALNFTDAIKSGSDKNRGSKQNGGTPLTTLGKNAPSVPAPPEATTGTRTGICNGSGKMPGRSSRLWSRLAIHAGGKQYSGTQILALPLAQAAASLPAGPGTA